MSASIVNESTCAVAAKFGSPPFLLRDLADAAEVAPLR